MPPKNAAFAHCSAKHTLDHRIEILLWANLEAQDRKSGLRRLRHKLHAGTPNVVLCCVMAQDSISGLTSMLSTR